MKIIGRNMEELLRAAGEIVLLKPKDLKKIHVQQIEEEITIRMIGTLVTGE